MSVKWGFAILLSAVLAVFKLTEKIDWHWIWIVSPIWIGYLLTVAAFFLGVVLVRLAESRAPNEG